MPMHSWDEDADARRINAQPWEPLRGMVKLRCTRCQFWHASRDPQAERCVDCENIHQRALRIATTKKAAA